MAAAAVALPGLCDAAHLILPGTPIRFQRFTRRELGWVGGFPQRHLLQTWGSRLVPGLWMVGDRIFPGQSTASVALGGLCVAQAVPAKLATSPTRWTFAAPVRQAYLIVVPHAAATVGEATRTWKSARWDEAGTSHLQLVAAPATRWKPYSSIPCLNAHIVGKLGGSSKKEGATSVQIETIIRSKNCR